MIMISLRISQYQEELYIYACIYMLYIVHKVPYIHAVEPETLTRREGRAE